VSVRRPTWDESSPVLAVALAGLAFVLHGPIAGAVLLLLAGIMAVLLWTPLRDYLGVPHAREISLPHSGQPPFAAETSGSLQMSRILTEPWDLKPDDFCYFTIARLRITNRQSDKPLSVDVRLHLPIELSGTSQPLAERSHKNDVIVPDAFLPQDPLVCPFPVDPGSTVTGDVTFLMRGNHFFRAFNPPVTVQIELVDYVSDTFVMLEIGDRVPNAPVPLSRDLPA